MIALGALAGDLVQASVESLPAATTTFTPAFVNFKIALFSAVDTGPPILILTTA